MNKKIRAFVANVSDFIYRRFQVKKKVLVVGAGKTGITTANFLANLGLEVTLNDKNKIKDTFKIHRKVKIVDNGHYEKIFKESELIVVSPGVNTKKLKWLKDKVVIGDIELFSWFDESKVIAITGTNGKTTTTYLTGEILKQKYNVFVGGNIGTPALARFLPFEEYQYSVLELSSFQLEIIDKFYADFAVILNITPDHLDRYETFDEYVQAKLNILKNQKISQYVILNKDYPMLNNLTIEGKSVYFQRNSILTNNSINVIFQDKKLSLDINKIKLKGRHFYEDIYVASLLGLINDVSEDEIKDVVYNFKGLEHRLEFVMEKDGISYYNDSKSTTVSSTCRAVESFSENVILILGGVYKGESFKKLLNYKNIKEIVCYGEAAKIILFDLKKLKPVKKNNLEEAVFYAESIAEKGETILFSPACSSFDMFNSYMERGNFFKSIITNNTKT